MKIDNNSFFNFNIESVH